MGIFNIFGMYHKNAIISLFPVRKRDKDEPYNQK